MLEKEIESYLDNSVKMMGGITLKFTSPNVRGVPDRIVGYFGQVYFVEVKRPGEKPRPLQVVVQNRLRNHGLNVVNVDSKESVDQFCQMLVRTR